MQRALDPSYWGHDEIDEAELRLRYWLGISGPMAEREVPVVRAELLALYQKHDKRPAVDLVGQMLDIAA